MNRLQIHPAFLHTSASSEQCIQFSQANNSSPHSSCSTKTIGPTPPSNEENTDVRSRRETFSTPKKSKYSSSKDFTRRLLEELNNLQHKYPSNQAHHLRHEEDSLPHASSSTTSHPTRYRHRSHSRARSFRLHVRITGDYAGTVGAGNGAGKWS